MDEVEGNKLRRRRVGDIRRAVCGKRQQHEEVCAHQVEHERVDDRGMEFRYRPSATVLVDHVGDGDKEGDYRKQDACGEDVAQIYVQSVLASSLLLFGPREVFAWLCEIVRGPNDALLGSSSVAALSSRAFPLHMQKPLADAPARVGGDGPSVGAHDPMVGDDHGERVFSHRGPNSAV